jgi:hypothetical protein
MDTYQGNVKRLEQSWEEFQKTIGISVIPQVNNLVKALDTLLGGGIKVKQSAHEIALANITATITKLEQQGQTGTKAYKNLIAAQEEWMLIVAMEAKKENDITNAKVNQKQQANDIILNDDIALIDMEIALEQSALEASLKAQQIKLEGEKQVWTDIINLAASSSQAITALGVATNSVTLKGMGIVISGVESAIKAVNAMMLASGPVAFILGLLGFVTSIGTTVSSLNQLGELEKQNASLLQTDNTGITTITQPNTQTNNPITSTPTSIERASNPVYYNINNTYTIQAGAILGDEFNISKAFEMLMQKYDSKKALTMSGV